MGKYLFLFMIILFSSCDRKVDTSFVLNKVLINKTNKALYYLVKTTVDEKNIQSSGNDSVGHTFVKNDYVYTNFITGNITNEIESVGLISEVIFNMSDTTKFEFTINRQKWNYKDSLYWRHVYQSVDGGTFDVRNTEKLVFSDSIEHIMTKDYTMLDRFKEYYKRDK